MTPPTIALIWSPNPPQTTRSKISIGLLANGYPVNAAANPLRGLKTDAEYVAGIVKSISGPALLIGHSYGDSVITRAIEGSFKL